MNRLAGVTVIAVLLILGGMMSLGMGAVMWFSFQVASTLPEVQAQSAALPAAFQWVTVGMFAGIAAWALATGFGLLMMKRWARASALVIASMLALFGLLGIPFLFLIPFPEQLGVDSQIFFFIKIFMVLFYVAQAGLGLWWFVYFTRPKVGAAFQGATALLVEAGSQRPLSITVIGWLLVSYAIALPFPFFATPQVPFFGMVITGWVAAGINTAWCLAGTIAGVLLLRCKRAGWAWSVWALALGGASLLVSYATPGFADRFIEAAYKNSPTLLATDTPRIIIPAWFWIGSVFLMCGVPLYFLLTRRRTYLAACAAKSS
jgi:hypothetical protein